jgi:Nucleotidyl transferase of unknown function (DUF2204)
MANTLHKRRSAAIQQSVRPSAEAGHSSAHPSVPATAAGFFIEVIRTLQISGIRFLLGGTFAFSHYSKIPRATADLDIFVDPDSVTPILRLFEELGYHTAIPFPHWLAKIGGASESIDIIFNSGNGLARVDDEWFEHAPAAHVLGRRVRLIPPEEMIWSKAFVQERERFDGADVLHLIHETGQTLEWARLLRRFDESWRVLLAHLVLFGFVYPNRRASVPDWVLADLLERLRLDRAPQDTDVCFGTLLSREQYLHDIDKLQYRDARRPPHGRMTASQIDIWTAAATMKSDRRK